MARGFKETTETFRANLLRGLRPLFDAVQPFLYLLQHRYRRSSALTLAGVAACVLGTLILHKTPRSIRSAPIARPLILCVEDETHALDIRKKVLEQDGYDVVGATSAGAAMQILSKFPVCATMSDHMLQGETGMELAKRMKKLKPDVPIILFSGTIPEHFDSVDVYINKGEPTADFLRVVRQVVERYCS
ncbi:MAG: response regulator [Terriglobales bacterium]